MKTSILTSAIASALLCVTFTVSAEPPPLIDPIPNLKTPLTTSTEESAAADGRFIEAATQGGWAEIKASELAKDRTKREDIKGFAIAMVNDHKEMDKQLKAVADKLNVKQPREISAEQQAIFTLLDKANEGNFDRMYMDTMVADHKKAVALFEEASRTTKHPDIKAFAAANLPHLQGHLEEAQKLAKLVGSIAAK